MRKADAPRNPAAGRKLLIAGAEIASGQIVAGFI